jgi:hypothetical protein
MNVQHIPQHDGRIWMMRMHSQIVRMRVHSQIMRFGERVHPVYAHAQSIASVRGI